MDNIARKTFNATIGKSPRWKEPMVAKSPRQRPLSPKTEKKLQSRGVTPPLPHVYHQEEKQFNSSSHKRSPRATFGSSRRLLVAKYATM